MSTLKISTKNQQILEQAKQYGLYLYDIVDAYGIGFTIQLFRCAEQQKKKGWNNTVAIIYPNKKEFNDEKTSQGEKKKFRQLLKESGFKIGRNLDDFIDEDTGEIVTIKSYYFKKLTNKKPAMYVAYHDDSPCHEQLSADGKCPSCGFHPDMQSKALYLHCPNCDVKLTKLCCPGCNKRFSKPK